MATAAHSSAPADGATGNATSPSASRRAMLGLIAAVPAAGFSAAPAVGFASAQADCGAFSAAWRAWRDALANEEGFYRDVMKPVDDGIPPLPDFSLRIGTDRQSGEPLYRRFSAYELVRADTPQNSAYATCTAVKAARPLAIEHVETFERYMRETKYDELEREGDRLVDIEATLMRRMIETPAPDLRSLACKVSALFKDGEVYDAGGDGAAALYADAMRLGAGDRLQ